MPSFDTPEPIAVRVSLGAVVANVRIQAGERGDTQVELTPVDPTGRNDLRAVERIRIEYAAGTLSVTGPRAGSWFGRTGSVDLSIELPAGSTVQGETGMGELRCDGRLGECQFKSGFGDLRLQQVGSANLNTGSGTITVEQADGHTEVTTGSGMVHLRRIDGAATVRNSNGDSWIGEATGELRVKSANGSITVERAHAGLTAKTANGSIRVGEVARGAVLLETAAGGVDVGIRTGTAAWLDLNTTVGRVRNELSTSDGPGDAEETVELRARTHVGDIVVHRS